MNDLTTVHPSSRAEENALLFLAAIVVKSGGRVVVGNLEFAQIEHIDLDIQQTEDGGVEFTARVREAS